MRSNKSHPNTVPDAQTLLNSDFSSRKFVRELEICEKAKSILERCNYRSADRRILSVAPSAEHGVVGMRVRDAAAIWVYLASPMKWRDEIYKRGIANISGSFVLRVMEQVNPDSMIVLAVKQGRG